jgi:hypothetical protein
MEEKYEYTKMDYVKDGIACVCLCVGLFVLTWIAFALDVITTGM